MLIVYKTMSNFYEFLTFSSLNNTRLYTKSHVGMYLVCTIYRFLRYFVIRHTLHSHTYIHMYVQWYSIDNLIKITFLESRLKNFIFEKVDESNTLTMLSAIYYHFYRLYTHTYSKGNRNQTYVINTGWKDCTKRNVACDGFVAK